MSDSSPLPPAVIRTGHRPIDRLRAVFLGCLHDDSGSALTEYSVVMWVTLPLIFFLFHPDNGFYQAARDEIRMTQTVLAFPGH